MAKGKSQYCTWFCTNCNAARRMPYQIDIVSAGSGGNSVQRFYTSFDLKIVPPAPSIYTIQLGVSNVQITWFKPNCMSNVKGYNIYRKTGSNAWAKGCCGKTMPLGSEGYQFVVREPYEGKVFRNYRFKYGILKNNQNDYNSK